MSYCPECCSEDVDITTKEDKKHCVCEVCGHEWIEENGPYVRQQAKDSKCLSAWH